LAGRTVFAGHLEDPADAYAALDLFLLPSLNEGQGRSVVEAMAAGIPVIASDVGGLPEVLDQGRAGILVPPGSPCALAAATEKLLSSRELANQLALEASRHILNYGDLAMIDAIERLYRDLLEKYVENSAQ
jgi:glycosyltransferase involved in cell wall biosynthesis